MPRVRATVTYTEELLLSGPPHEMANVARCDFSASFATSGHTASSLAALASSRSNLTEAAHSIKPVSKNL